MLINSDAMSYVKSLESNSVDLALIDPPYAISRETNFQSGDLVGDDRDRFRISMDFGTWDVVDNEYFKELFKEIHRVLRRGGYFICFYDLWKIQELSDWMKEAKFKQLRMIEWIKTNPVPINSKINYLTNAREVAITAVKGGKPTFHGEYHNGIFHYPIYQGKDRFHPTQKSLPLMEELIRLHSNEGELVMDCFAGSASTLVAAQNTNRLYTGCELDENYFNLAVERLNNNV